MRVGALRSSLTPGALESVRVNAANNSWEVFAPLAVTTQNANLIYGGPSTGSPAVPTFRALVANDLPTVPVTKGGTGTTTQFTAGSVVFAGASGVYSQDNASLFFDDTNNRLGIGKNSGLVGKLHIDAPNSDYTNTGGAGANILMANSAGSQNVLYSEIGGTMRAKWRTDNAGNVNWVANGGYHGFYTGGDYGSGTVRLFVASDGDVQIGNADNVPNAQFEVRNDTAADKVILFAAHASQSANVLEITNSASSPQVIVDSSFKFGIGIAPAAPLHVVKTTEQARFGYDGSNYVKATVSSVGAVTWDAVGSGAKHVFSDDVDLSERLLQDGLDIEPYLVYDALISQTGTSAPTADVTKNTLGAIVWTRNSAGSYTGTLTGAFSTQDKCWFTPKWSYYPEDDLLVKITYLNANTILLESELAVSGTDGILSYFPISIKVKKP